MTIFNFIELKYNELKKQTYEYLNQVFDIPSEKLSNASPYGQVINYLNNFFQMNILYLKRAVSSLIIDQSNNVKIIRSLSRISGHNPSRSISATGTISLSVKPSVDLVNDFDDNRIRLYDKTKIKNKTNGLTYTIRIGKEYDIYHISHNHNIYFNIIQGEYQTSSYTGNGEVNQSISVNVPSTSFVDNFEVSVKYNGESLNIKDSMMDMGRSELSCFTRTGMNGGIDIYFGNGNFGFIPIVGSLIEVTFLLGDGTGGNILTPQLNDFVFLDDVYDMSGSPIDVSGIFDINLDDPVKFSSNGETIDFTKSMMPNVSRNFVLASPSQYIYTLKRLNMFSKINVYRTLNDSNILTDNKVFLFLVPKISNYFTGGVNYFNVPLTGFYLDDTDKRKTITYLQRLANIPIGTVIDIIQPKINKYVMNVYIRKYAGYSDTYIKETVTNEVSVYLSELERDDRIVKSDMIRIIEDVEGVDSVSLTFISKRNEDLYRDGQENKFEGLDPVLGDIVVKYDQLAIIRGGWSDRNGTYYNETIDEVGLGPINIIFVGETQKGSNNK